MENGTIPIQSSGVGQPKFSKLAAFPCNETLEHFYYLSGYIMALLLVFVVLLSACFLEVVFIVKKLLHRIVQNNLKIYRFN